MSSLVLVFGNYVGFSMSFGGKWFGGYRRDEKNSKGCVKNMETQSRRSYESLLAQAKFLVGIEFQNVEYWNLEIPPQSIIYCDPPYKGTTGYKDSFDHDKFYDWLREKHKEGHTVFVSEYSMPDDFVCVWSKKMNNSLTQQTDSKKGFECLFKLE